MSVIIGLERLDEERFYWECKYSLSYVVNLSKIQEERKKERRKERQRRERKKEKKKEKKRKEKKE